MILGVSWSGQFVYALTSFGFGFAGGIISRLYACHKLNKIEQGIVDFFTTIILALLYIISVEIGGKGQPTAYSLLSFSCGAILFNFLWKKIALSLRARRRRCKFVKK